MIGMGVGDDGPLDWTPGIDEKIPGFAVQSPVGHLQQGMIWHAKV